MTQGGELSNDPSEVNPQTEHAAVHVYTSQLHCLQSSCRNTDVISAFDGTAHVHQVPESSTSLPREKLSTALKEQENAVSKMLTILSQLC